MTRPPSLPDNAQAFRPTVPVDDRTTGVVPGVPIARSPRAELVQNAIKGLPSRVHLLQVYDGGFGQECFDGWGRVRVLVLRELGILRFNSCEDLLNDW